MRLHKEIKYEITKEGCWNCVSHCKNMWGYPRKYRNGKLTLISRIMYEKNVGKVPDGLLILHTCDNPACINPDHLWLGNNADNMKDMKLKGRANRPIGVKNGRAKLSEDTVLKILLDTDSNKKISIKFNLPIWHIQAIKSRKLWKHVKIINNIEGMVV
jgi:hypothetical protein